MPERDDIKEWLALAALPGLGCILMHRLLAAFGSPQNALAAGRAVAHVEGIGPKLAAIFVNQTALSQARSWADQEHARAAAAGIQLLSCDNPLYPFLLRNIHDPPVLLWCRGDLACLHQPSVAIVGSRNPTEYGSRISFMLAQQLAQAGIGVVSGLASGIDGQAHAGALAARGKTTAILGCGVDVVYPRFHSRLYEQTAAHGLLVSEYPLGTQPEGFRFPARNRIISGLALGVVVVEAAGKSGALITARLALEQNREVFAVPGRIDSPKSEGTHSLLRQGAHLVHSVEDILAELPPTTAKAGDSGSKDSGPKTLPDDLSEAEKSLLALLEAYSADIEELTEKSRLPVGTLHGLLLELELKGLIRQLPGQQYEKI